MSEKIEVRYDRISVLEDAPSFARAKAKEKGKTTRRASDPRNQSYQFLFFLAFSEKKEFP